MCRPAVLAVLIRLDPSSLDASSLRPSSLDPSSLDASSLDLRTLDRAGRSFVLRYDT
jgi:hypothetical protein